MSFEQVFKRGDDFIGQYPRTEPWWNFASKVTCWLAVGFGKLVLNTSYKPSIYGLENLDKALQRSKDENRGLMTVSNHMSTVDDPFMWGALPWKYYKDIDEIRWGLAAENLCFSSAGLSYFFSLGKILACGRFGRGPFQGSIDAAIRILSPDDTLDLLYDGSEDVKSRWLNYKNNLTPITQKIQTEYLSPMIRNKPSWFHVFPEGFVLQLEKPFSNSMRYFKWGVSRMVLEATRQPIILPIFSHGFEKIAPETAAGGSLIERFLPANFGAEITITFGEPIDDAVIQKYRKEWLQLVRKYGEVKNAVDLNDDLRYNEEVQQLRSRLASEIRASVANLREQVGYPEEDPRFKQHEFWKRYTLSEGKSDPDVVFIGQNWAIRRLQPFLKENKEFNEEKK